MRSIAVLAIAGLLTASIANQANAESTPSPAASPQSESETQIVKSIDGSFEGEIVGHIAPDSRFAKLKIGMTMSEVNKLIKAPDDLQRHETGKRWIPFYFGDDAQRMQATYTGEGCLTYTGGNVFGGGGNQLIRITADTEGCAVN
jgi:hypothetical protein